MKARGFLARKKLQPVERLDATRHRIAKSTALKLARSVGKIIAAKGKSVVVFDMTKDAPSDADLAAAIVGPTGNLRAPTLRRGSTLIVGFSSDLYERVFGASSETSEALGDSRAAGASEAMGDSRLAGASGASGAAAAPRKQGAKVRPAKASKPVPSSKRS